MRFVVRRVRPWSAAKIGALLGFIQGLIVGALIAASASAALPYLAYIDEPVQPIGLAGIVLIALLVASASAVAFTVTALLYNLVSWLGASLVVELDREESGAKPDTRPNTPLTGEPILGIPMFETP
jgi:hypothetical protein